MELWLNQNILAAANSHVSLKYFLMEYPSLGTTRLIFYVLF